MDQSNWIYQSDDFRALAAQALAGDHVATVAMKDWLLEHGINEYKAGETLNWKGYTNGSGQSVFNRNS